MRVRKFEEFIKESLNEESEWGGFLERLQGLIDNIAPQAWGNKSQLNKDDLYRVHDELKKIFGIPKWKKLNKKLKTSPKIFSDWHLPIKESFHGTDGKSFEVEDKLFETEITYDEIHPDVKKKLDKFLSKHKAKVLKIYVEETTYFKDNEPDRVEPTGDYQISFDTWSVYNKARGPVSEFGTEMVGIFLNKADAAVFAKNLNAKDAGAMFYKDRYNWDIAPTNANHRMGFKVKDLI